MTTNKKNVTILGYNANVTEEGGVALGANSAAGTKAGIFGWDPAAKDYSTTDSPAWKSSWAAVSVGDGTHTRQITNVAAGAADTDAVNVAQLKAVANAAGSSMKLVAGDGISIVSADGTYTISANIKGGSTDTDDVKVEPKKTTTGGNTTTDNPGTDAGTTDTDTTNPSNGKELIVTAETKPTTFSADSGEATAVKPGETLAIHGDTDNITTASSDHGLTVSLKKDISVDSVTAGDTKMTSNGLTIAGGPSVTKSGIDAGGRKITNVANGDISADSKDAVNGSQLYGVQKNVESIENNVTNLGNRINRMDDRIDRVGAGAAALAALHPQDFDPADKWDFAAGYGNYRSASAMALGAFYRPDARTMFSVGGSMGGGENMVNVGVSLKLGKASPYAGYSKAALTTVIADQKKQLDAQAGTISTLTTQNAELNQKVEKQQAQIDEILRQLAELKK